MKINTNKPQLAWDKELKEKWRAVQESNPPDIILCSKDNPLYKAICYKEDWIREYQCDFIPREGEVFVGIDYGKDESDCVVKGFWDKATGEY